MRIIGGKLKGRRFTPPKVNPARPTTDFAKEGLFNIIANYWDISTIRFLDLFCGTGSISYEMASRGCTQQTGVEKDPALAAFIRKNAEELNIKINLAQMDVFKFIARKEAPYDLIFAGPPYPLPTLDTIPDKIFEAELIRADGWLILEHNPNHKFDDHPRFMAKRNYGDTIFSIFEGELKEEAIEESGDSNKNKSEEDQNSSVSSPS
ncbi:MAG: 16S rRNA (guanine966-N2)-methyltransferase [Limisphaerales bacterium]|jgi:16S rRNA (guanine966-N2)-methyltransferase